MTESHKNSVLVVGLEDKLPREAYEILNKNRNLRCEIVGAHPEENWRERLSEFDRIVFCVASLREEDASRADIERVIRYPEHQRHMIVVAKDDAVRTALHEQDIDPHWFVARPRGVPSSPYMIGLSTAGSFDFVRPQPDVVRSRETRSRKIWVDRVVGYVMSVTVAVTAAFVGKWTGGGA